MSDHYDRYNGMEELLGTDLISRAAAQTELQLSARRYTVAHEAHGEGRVVWSEDLISVSDAMDVLRKIPSAQPTFDARDTQYNLPIGTDLISRAQAIDAVKRLSLGETDATRLAMRIGDYLERLPSAPPKMGKWIYHIDDLFPAESTMECNQCHAEQPLTCDDEFCPHCGAKMEVTE